jgi:uncharacterized coiled-coil DUF342 family protein
MTPPNQPNELQRAFEYIEQRLMPYSDGSHFEFQKIKQRVEELEKERDELKVSRLNAGQKIAALRTALSKAHDAMCSWFSSEYAAHPISKQIRDALYNTPKENIEQEHDTLKAALEKCAKALDEISTHLDPIDAALRKTQVSAFSEDDESYWIHEINSHNANAKLINTALSNPTVQAALRGIKPPNHPIE